MPDFNKVETEKCPTCLRDINRQVVNFQSRFIGHSKIQYSKNHE